MSDPRELERRRFLATAGLSASRCVALPADASPRRYFRIESSVPAQLLMETAPGCADAAAFVAIAGKLGALGLSAPRVLRADLAAGFALIEDFGSLTYTRALAAGHDETALYELAVDTLVALHRAPQAMGIELPAYDIDALLHETELFAQWYAPRLLPGIAVADFTRRHQSLWRDALAEIGTRREALVLRDYHVDNLMLVAGRSGVAACGLLDFQDALIGARAYDLMSLCQDARRDLAPGLEEHLIERYLAAMPGLDQAQFLSDYWLLAAQRHAKVAGIFERLAGRDGKTGYLQHQPRVLRLLARSLERAGLADLIELLDRELPG